MQLTEDTQSNRYQLKAFNHKGFLINQRYYDQSVLLTPDELILDWPQALSDLNNTHLKRIVTLKPDLVIIGTGDTMQFLSPEILTLLHQARIGVEVMPTQAACRTHSALCAENRRVISALFTA